MAIYSKGKGKSGGARVYHTCLCCKNNNYLISIYDKSDQVDLEDKELASLLSELPE